MNMRAQRAMEKTKATTFFPVKKYKKERERGRENSSELSVCLKWKM
jgi:hypothetical protein